MGHFEPDHGRQRSNVAVRHYRPEDEQRVLGLLQWAFPAWPRTAVDVPALEHLRWKLESEGAHTASVIAEIDGQIAGFCASSTAKARLAGESVTVARGHDLAVGPAFQGRGVYSALSRARLSSCSPFALVLQDVAGEVTRETAARNGYELLANEIEVLRWRRSLPRAAREAFSSSRNVALIEIAEADFSDEAPFDALFEAAAREFWFIRERTAAALRHRYGDPRAGRFRVLVARESEALLGYVVVAPRERKGAIADLLAAPGRDDVVRALAATAVALLRREGSRVIRCWLPRVHPYRAALLAADFASEGLVATHHFRPMQLAPESLQPLRDPSTPIHLMLGDSDTV